MGAMPGHASHGAGWAVCPCPGRPLGEGEPSCEGTRCLSRPGVNLPRSPRPTATRQDPPARHGFLALSGSTAGPGEPPAAGREPGPSGCHARRGLQQMRGDTRFLKARRAGVWRAGGKGLPTAGLERGHGAGVARGTAAPICSAWPQHCVGRRWNGEEVARFPAGGCVVLAGWHSPAPGPAMMVNPGATAVASQARGERVPWCSRCPHASVAPRAPSHQGSGPSPPQPHRAPRSRASASPRSRLIRSTLLAFPFPPGKPTQPLRLFSARCPGCGPEREAGAGLRAAGPPPQAAARPQHRVGGTAAGDPEGEQLLPRLGVSRGMLACRRWGRCSGKQVPSRSPWGLLRGQRPPACSHEGRGMDPRLSLWLQPLAGSSGVQGRGAAHEPRFGLSPSLPIALGCPVLFRASSDPSGSSSCPEPPGRTEPGRLGGRRCAGAVGRRRSGACAAQSLPEPVRGLGAGMAAALVAPSPPPAGDFALRHPSR